MFNIGRMEHGLLRSEAVQQLECLKHPSDSDHTDTVSRSKSVQFELETLGAEMAQWYERRSRE